MNPLVYFFGLAGLIGVILLLFRLPYAAFLFRRIRQYSWPTAEGTLSKAGLLPVTVFDGDETKVVWDSVFQVSFLAGGNPAFGYFGFWTGDVDRQEAQRLQPAWDGAKVQLRDDPSKPDTFVLDRSLTATYDIVYLPEFSGSSFGNSPDPLELPKSADLSESQ